MGKCSSMEEHAGERNGKARAAIAVMRDALAPPIGCMDAALAADLEGVGTESWLFFPSMCAPL